MLTKFDQTNVRWYTLEGIPDVWYNILEVDEKSRTVDILFKFSANAKIVLHRHWADYRTFIIQGELRLYNAAGELIEIRGIGSYVAKAAGGEPHPEGHQGSAGQVARDASLTSPAHSLGRAVRRASWFHGRKPG